jgi:hypothetical protein
MAAKKKNRPLGIEWVGGVISMPTYVTGEGEPYRPDVMIWMGAQGAVLGSMTGKPGELLSMAAESLQNTIERPLFGDAHAPTRVRVAAQPLAAVLQQSHPAIEFVCASTPELDVVAAMLRDKLGQDAEAAQSYLSDRIHPEVVAACFRAAAELFRIKPWSIVPNDTSLISVTIERFGLRDATLSVIGQMGQSLGFILFSSLADFEHYLGAAEAMQRGERPQLPKHFALNFERGAELASGLRKEIAEHHFEVAGSDAYPWLVAVDEELVVRPPTLDEFTVAETICLALPKLLSEHEAVQSAWDGGEPVTRTLSVHTQAGEVEVTLRAP